MIIMIMFFVDNPSFCLVKRPSGRAISIFFQLWISCGDLVDNTLFFKKRSSGMINLKGAVSINCLSAAL